MIFSSMETVDVVLSITEVAFGRFIINNICAPLIDKAWVFQDLALLLRLIHFCLWMCIKNAC